MIYSAIKSYSTKANHGKWSRQVRLITSRGGQSSNRDVEEAKKGNVRHFHKSSENKQSDAQSTSLLDSQTKSKITNGLAHRFKITAEVTVSKIFPAGFGWQTASIYANSVLSLPTDSMTFAVATGVGDGLGVLAGHTCFYGLKKAITGNANINLAKEMQTGVWLGGAAFCSGTAWQPIVNALQGANLSFNEVFAGTWIGCGAAFYVGLRAGRTLLSGAMTHIDEPTNKNLKNDASLSMAIGGATGFFVGTDAAYLPDQNFLIDIVGIKAGTPDIVGCAIAGSSTSMGFATAQSTMNMVFPAGKCWND